MYLCIFVVIYEHWKDRQTYLSYRLATTTKNDCLVGLSVVVYASHCLVMLKHFFITWTQKTLPKNFCQERVILVRLSSSGCLHLSGLPTPHTPYSLHKRGVIKNQLLNCKVLNLQLNPFSVGSSHTYCVFRLLFHIQTKMM